MGHRVHASGHYATVSRGLNKVENELRLSYRRTGPYLSSPEKMSFLTGRETAPDSPSDEQQARYFSERDASWQQFFCENEQRESDDPN